MTLVGSNLMIVDMLNMAFRWKHSGAVDFAEEFLKTINSLKRSYKASHVILACDKGSSKYRKGIYPEYKQNRKDKFEVQTEAEKLAFELFFEAFEKSIVYIQENSDYPLLRFQGVEADDIAARICSVINQYSNIEHTWLISSDADWDLLVNENVSRFSYVTRKEITLDNWREKYEFEPEDYISIKVITGDTGDNVLGVAGIGPKRAAALVLEYGSALDIVASIPISSKYKYVQELNKSKDLILLNYKLMDLVSFCEEAIGEENCEVINSKLTEYLL